MKLRPDQSEILHRILGHLVNTELGSHFRIRQWKDRTDFYSCFNETIPVVEYDEYYTDWISRALRTEKPIIWDELFKYIALTSGTGNNREKHIPYTKTFIRSLIRSSRQLIPRLLMNGVSPFILLRKILTVGGSTDFTGATQRVGAYGYLPCLRAGFMSGIIYHESPSWYSLLNVPGKKIHALTDWEEKTDIIAENAYRYNIGTVTGFPSYVLPLFRKILDHYQARTIHDIWPHLRLYVHSGMPLGHYKSEILSCLGKDTDFYETYYATEGFFGCSEFLNSEHMILNTDSAVFYEFIELSSENFSPEGRLIPNATAVPVNSVQENVPYAMVITNYCGLVRMLQGDVLIFSDAEKLRFRLNGRINEMINNSGEIIPVIHIREELIRYCAINQLPGIREMFMTSDIKEGRSSYCFFIVSDDRNTDHFAGLDSHLSRNLPLYRSYRADGLMRCPVINMVKEDIYNDFLLRSGKLNGQAKMPFYVSGSLKEQLYRLLINNGR